MPPLPRLARAALLATAATLTAVVGVAGPALAVDATINTAGGTLNVRSSPSTTAGIVTTVADGDTVDISCQTTGSTITGTYGTSNIWDYLPAKAGYVANADVNTGGTGRVAPDCATPMTTSSQCTLRGAPARCSTPGATT